MTTTPTSVEFVSSFQTIAPFVFILVVNLIIEVLKIFEKQTIAFNDRAKDVVYPVLAGILVALLKFFGFIDLDWSAVLPLLFAPQGVFVVVKKLLGK